MKINSCNIASFGKFKNYKIDFSSGFNLIYGDNEAGKSTVMSFIKMMFYGNAGRVSDIDKNLRKKYMPWDSSLMAGSIDFSVNDKNYRLEREFRGSNATDKITLTDLALGTEIKLDSKGDVGSKIFGLSEAAFEKTVFIGSLGAPEKNSAADGELNGKLSNLTSTGDEDVSFEKVSQRIKKAREFYKSKSGRIGVYDKAVATLNALEGELQDAKEIEKQAESLVFEIKEKETAAAENTAKANRYFSVMKKAELASKRSNLIKYIEASKIKEKALSSLTLPDGSVADKAYSERIDEAKRNLDLIEKNLSDKNNETESLRLEIEDLKTDKNDSLTLLTEQKTALAKKIEALDLEAEDYRKNLSVLQADSVNSKKQKPNIALIIASVVSLSLAIICFIINLFLVSLIFVATGLLMLILGLFPPKKKQSESIMSDISSNQQKLNNALYEITKLQKELEDLNLLINSTIAENGGKKALLEAKQKELLEKSEAVLKIKSEILDIKANLSSLCKPFGDSIEPSQASSFIEKALHDIASADVMIGMAADSTNCQSLEEAETRLAALDSDEALRGLTAEDIASAKDEYRRLADNGAHLRGEIATLKSKLKALISSDKTVPVLELKIQSLKETIKAEEDFCNATDIALEVLTDSFSAMRESFGGKLENETSKIFSKLTGGTYSSLDISKDFEIKANKDGVFGAKEWQFLSAGTADQAYLSLRIALSKLIGDDSLPLIMDDSLAQYDDKRSSVALEFLSEYAKDHQLLLFTCHSDIKNSAEKLGVNSINM